MRKIVLAYLIILIGATVIKAQTVEWGNQQKTKSKTNYSQVLGENSSGVFVARARNGEFKNNIVLEKYKANLAQELTKELTQPENSVMERIIVTEGGVLQFHSVKQSSGAVDVQVVQMDNSLNLVTQKSLLTAEALGGERKLFIRHSSDKKLFTVFYLSEGKEKGKSVMNVVGFDAAFTQKFTRRFGLNYELDDIYISATECDNKGNVFALMDFPNDGKKQRDKKARNYFLYAYFPEADNMLEYELDRDSVYINEAELVVNNYAKTVNVAGFYSDKADERCVGTVYFKLDLVSTEMQVKSFDPIDLTFASKVAGIMQNERAPVLSDLYIRKLVPNSDGGCTIIAEKYYETKQSYTSTINGFPQTNYRTVYNYDEVVIIAKNADGSLKFRDFIKKNQASMSDGGYYSSFVTMLANDKIGIVYNSEVVNEGDVMLSTISTKGVVDHKVLIKSMSYYVTIMPPESRQISGNAAIISTLKDRRFCLMRLTF